jgi:uncharacterized protein (TIRG00374 family)
MLYFIVHSGHLDVKVLSRLFLNPQSAALLLALAAANLFLLIVRWYWIVNDTLKPLSLVRSTQLSMIGNFFNFVFPSSIGGDVVRGFYLAQDFPDQKMKAALSVVVDRVIGLYSLICLGCFSLLWISVTRANPALAWLTWSTCALFLGYTVVLIFLMTAGAQKLLTKITFQPLQKSIAFLLGCHDYLRECLKNPWLFLKTFFVGLFSQALVSVFFYVVAVYIGQEGVSFVDLLSITPLGFLVMSIPIAPAGIGVGQVAYLFLMKQVTGEASEFGPTAISAFQLSLLLWSFFGGWFYLTLKKPKELKEGLYARTGDRS